MHHISLGGYKRIKGVPGMIGRGSRGISLDMIGSGARCKTDTTRLMQLNDRATGKWKEREGESEDPLQKGRG